VQASRGKRSAAKDLGEAIPQCREQPMYFLNVGVLLASCRWLQIHEFGDLPTEALLLGLRRRIVRDHAGSDVDDEGWGALVARGDMGGDS
jgi:hypothetical protein